MAFNKLKHIEKIVSAFVLTGIVIIITLVLLIGNFDKWFTSSIEYYSYLPSAAGIDRGLIVKLKGVGFEIGNVEDFSLTEDNRVLVKLNIFRKYISKIRRDSVLYVRKPTIGLFGKVYLEISVGAKELKILKPSSFIPSNKTFEGKLLIASKARLAGEEEQDSDLNLPGPIKKFLERINYILDPDRPYLKNMEEILFRVKGILTTADKYGLLSVVGSRRFQNNIEQITRNMNDLTTRQLKEIMERVVSVMTTVEATANTVIGVRLPRIMRNLENVLVRAETVLRNLERSPIFGGRGNMETGRSRRSGNRQRNRSVLIE